MFFANSMELKLVNKGKEKLEIEVVGETHTFCNAIRKELWEDKTIEVAGYNFKHSLIDNPKLIVEAKNPEKSLKDAADRLKKKNKEFLSKFSKAVK